MDNYKISLFHAKMHFYVPTNNYLWEHLRNNSYDQVVVIDVSILSYEEIVNIAKNSDAIFIDHSIRYAVGAKESAGAVFYFDSYKSADEYLKIWLGLLSLPVKKAYSLVLSDMQSMKNPNHQECMEPYFDVWLNSIDCVFWGYEHNNASKEHLNSSYLDEYLNAPGTGNPAINRNQILSKRIITIDFPHFVDEKELVTKVIKKRWNWVISGALYATRKIAHQSLCKLQTSTPPNLDQFKWFINTSLKKLRIWFKFNKLSLVSMAFNNLLFKYLISRSKVSFVCGGGYNYMVRKFYEIPAFNVGLVAYPADGMSEYGFIDGVHYLSCTPETAGEVAKRLLDDDVLRQSLIDAARNLIEEQHVTKVRAQQLIDCMRSLAHGRLLGARYERGKFNIKEK